MTRLRRLALLAAFTLCGTAAAKDPYGPSWVGGGPPGGYTRPAKVETSRTAVSLGEVCPPIGVEVRMWGDVGNVQTGHKYQLMYQLRVQTKKGELGPLLGDAKRPSGVAYVVKELTADENWNGLEGWVDITRKDLTGRTNLPANTPRIDPLILRVEPQLFDLTASKFVSEGKPQCLFLVVDVVNGTVTRIKPLHVWLRENSDKVATEPLAMLDRLDMYDAVENRLHTFYESLIDQPVLLESDYVALLKAMPVEVLASKSGYAVRTRLEKLANDEKASAELRAAAKAKLDEK